MSAYVIEQEKFNALFTSIENRRNMDAFRHIFRDALPTECLIEEWFNMNVEAVCQRYGEEERAEYSFEAPRLSSRGIHCSDLKLIALLDCLIYQCSEGNVPESRTYKELVDMRNDLTHYYTMSRPEYSWNLRE
jgi:hypothetical protein